MNENMELVENRLQFYTRNNPKLANKIFRRLLNYMHREGLVPMDEIQEELSCKLNKPVEQLHVDPNRPLPFTDRAEIDVLNRIILDHSRKCLAAKVIFDQINLVIKREAAKKIIEISERPEVTFKELNSEIQSFCNIIRGETLLSPEEAIGTRVALLRKLVSDHLAFIKIAKHHVTIRDFGPIARSMIGPEKGMGRIGGKAAGLLVASAILRRARETDPEIGDFKIPTSYYIRSDVISNFINMNNLDEFINVKYSDIDTIRSEYPLIQKTMCSSRFPPEVESKLRLMLLNIGEVPLIVRSSSHLEDSVGCAFSGKYLSLFLGNQGDLERRLQELINAILQVYASTFSPDPLLYRKERDLLDYQEQMAVIIQTVVGHRCGDYFLPDFAGVAFSRNEFRWSPRIRREDGMLRLVFGLGTRAVDRVGDDFPRIVPLGIPTLSSAVRTEEILHYSQKSVDVIHLPGNRFETIPLTELLKNHWPEIPALNRYVSTFEDGAIRHPVGRLFNFHAEDAVLTFQNLLAGSKFPRQMRSILKALETAYGIPVDVEFAHDGQDLYLLQCRALSKEEESGKIEIPLVTNANQILFRADRHVKSGLIGAINYAVYVDPAEYEKLETLENLSDVGRAIGLLNQRLPRRKFILLGPGRWGSRGDIRLGVKVTYADINNTVLLMEIARRKGNYVPDLSYGTHFFNDLVEANIKYLPLFPDEDGVVLNDAMLSSSPNCFAELVPELARLSHVIKVLDINSINGGRALSIFMNGDTDEALALLDA